MSHGHDDNQPITVLGEANYRNRLRRFGIKQDDRRRHMYVIGKTGMGKSVFLENLAISDTHAGHGLCFIDPHGDTAEDMLDYIPPHRINDVIYFNPSDLDFPIAFNIFETVDPKYKHLVASGLVAVFKKMWADSWGPRLEYILRNAILALLDFPSSTLLGVPRMLVDKQYRKKVVAKITDPVVKSFWVGEFENYNEKFMTEAISPIQNKVGQFLSSSVVRNILGQVKSTIDLNEIMDNGKILILNLSKGKLGEDNSALIGAMMITKIQLAAMQRAAIPEEQRRDFFLYVDEFQNFATEAFATVLSEARKYRLNLTIANQYIEQMQEEVAAAVFGNVGTMVCFRVGAQDGEIFEKEFEPVFLMHDFVNLPKYNIYLKLMVDGIATPGFSAQTLPIMYERYNMSSKVIDVSRERYAAPRLEVEEKIMRWSGVQVVSATTQVADVIANEGQAPTPQIESATPIVPATRPQPAPMASSPRAPLQFQRGPQSPFQRPIIQQPEQTQSQVQPQQMQPVEQPQQYAPQPQASSSPLPTDLGDALPAEDSYSQAPVAQPQAKAPLPTEQVRVILPEELEKQRRAQNKKKKKGKKPVDPNRPMYQTVCDECGIPIEVPFVPDGSRPVLCQDCLPEFRSRMAKMEAQAREERGEAPLQQPVQSTKPQTPKSMSRPVSQPQRARPTSTQASSGQTSKRVAPRPTPQKVVPTPRPNTSPTPPHTPDKQPPKGNRPRIGQSVHF
jgi:CxxC-x17-CxxC domain-containing protein